MKLKNVLLLDMNPAGGLGGALRRILESAPHADVRLQLEAVRYNDSANQSQSEFPELISRLNPAVVFLVSSLNRLKQVKSLFHSMRQEPSDPPVIVVSDTTAPDEIFEIVKLGVADFITPPLKPIEILPRFWRVLERTKLGENVVQCLKNRVGEVKSLIGQSPLFLQQVNKIPLVANSDTSVLISGETGTGKEVFARAIHHNSPRFDQPFIPVNCGAIPIDLVENELFGHERGAFTGAATANSGLISAADGGTLFLDEIDSLPLLAQVKLLRFLQEKEYRPLGSNKVRHANVRIISATNIDVRRAVKEGKLRQDLYYRLNIIPMVLPPLRERRDDITLLADYFLEKYAAATGKHIEAFSPEARQQLSLYDWPGNVRELENTIERAVALAEGRVIHSDAIFISDAEAHTGQDSFQRAKAKIVEEFERTYLESLMLAAEGNITRAAQMAGKNRRAFWQLLRKRGINAESFRTKE